ncbi:unnamed protein product [Staurois parvus]|uniref:Uncharacterized protein n=1 Tax=Staurois parvus TaxID=386267 RepID=A0ABN9F2G0_9NEOB|nr:unnamed protein product [Staurois parvus]
MITNLLRTLVMFFMGSTT